jgi:hypothetical protein
MTREKKVLVNLCHLMAFTLVAGNSNVSAVFQSGAGFTIMYPALPACSHLQVAHLRLKINRFRTKIAIFLSLVMQFCLPV